MLSCFVWNWMIKSNIVLSCVRIGWNMTKNHISMCYQLPICNFLLRRILSHILPLYCPIYYSYTVPYTTPILSHILPLSCPIYYPYPVPYTTPILSNILPLYCPIYYPYTVPYTTPILPYILLWVTLFSKQNIPQSQLLPYKQPLWIVS